MKIVDSNILIYITDKRVNINDIICKNEEYAISIVTYMEVLGYNFKSIKEQVYMEDLISLFTTIEIDMDIANKVIDLRREYKVKLPDAIICATAILNNAVLISNDIKLKNIKELKLQILENKK